MVAAREGVQAIETGEGPDSSDDEEIGSGLDGVVEFMHLRSGRMTAVKTAARPARDNARVPSLSRIFDRRRGRLPTHREEGEELEASEYIHDQPYCPSVSGAAVCGSRSALATEQSPACATAFNSAASIAAYSRMLQRDTSRAHKNYIGNQAWPNTSVCRHARSGFEGLPMRHSGLGDAMLSL